MIRIKKRIIWNYCFLLIGGIFFSPINLFQLSCSDDQQIEERWYMYIDKKTNAQGNLFKRTIINDSIFVDIYHSLTPPHDPFYRKGCLFADTFKLVDNTLFLKHDDLYFKLFSSNYFNETSDTTCDYRVNSGMNGPITSPIISRIFNCYTPYQILSNKDRKSYVFINVFEHSVEEARRNNEEKIYGVDFHPKKGILAYREGRSGILTLHKMNISK